MQFKVDEYLLRKGVSESEAERTLTSDIASGENREMQTWRAKSEATIPAGPLRARPAGWWTF
jgi:hypothetical protein